jgi:hypothetical protein
MIEGDWVNRDLAKHLGLGDLSADCGRPELANVHHITQMIHEIEK